MKNGEEKNERSDNSARKLSYRGREIKRRINKRSSAGSSGTNGESDRSEDNIGRSDTENGGSSSGESESTNRNLSTEKSESGNSQSTIDFDKSVDGGREERGRIRLKFSDEDSSGGERRTEGTTEKETLESAPVRRV